MLPLLQTKFSGQKTKKCLEFSVGRIGIRAAECRTDHELSFCFVLPPCFTMWDIVKVFILHGN